MATLQIDEKHPETVDHAVGDQGLSGDLKDLSANAVAQGQALSGYESLTVWQTIWKFKMCSVLCFLAAVSAATEGYQISMIGNLVANPGFARQFGTQLNAAGEKVLASSTLSVWSSVGSCSQMMGQLSIAFISNKFGRKVAMFFFWTTLLLSVICEVVSRNWKVFLVSKVLGGYGVGCLQATVPLYISEIAPTAARGALIMVYMFWWITGQFFAPVALQVMSKTDPDNWLTPIYTQFGQVGLMFLIYLILPESPAWYVGRGQIDKAKKSLRFMYRGVTDFDYEHHIHLLVINIEHERAEANERKGVKWYEIFKGRDRLRTIISTWPLLSQQFIGLGVFFSYGTYFFQQAGVEDPFRITCITSGINIAATMVIIYLADITGRRLIACYGTSLCMLCNIGVGILGVSPKGKVSDNLLVVFAVFWNIGLIGNGASAYAYLSETSSQRLRTYTAGFANGMVAPTGIVLGVLVPYMLNANQWNWGLKTTWFFTGLGMPFTVAMWFLLPETKGRTTAELDELFERKIKPWRFHKTTTLTESLVEMKNDHPSVQMVEDVKLG
ncbi:general substrate transporter [Cadophora sp. MPI-SDFR-AT-0126]|nr:general substrate transporter [Leotiomycetes sp. MPI-SDFR-AT-0126]